MDEILQCYHSNETSLAELLHGTISYDFLKRKVRIFCEVLTLATIRGEKVKHRDKLCLTFGDSKFLFLK